MVWSLALEGTETPAFGEEGRFFPLPPSFPKRILPSRGLATVKREPLALNVTLKENLAASLFFCQVIIEKTDRHHDVLGHRECGPTLPRAKGGARALRLAAGAPRPLAARLGECTAARDADPGAQAGPATAGAQRGAVPLAPARRPAPPRPPEVAGAQLKEACVRRAIFLHGGFVDFPSQSDRLRLL
ncbi:unnamed protein product [Rangifer tarandus platyrhynchus]|uniref:Uncharacterized protein n=3 Tax=Rangifer tarandus platyrhynchus TaxID=3082113 RepID=A0ACB0FKV3_RANTA|nr:unnamed protein product [Rangifer tarandus platyrhynchus]CAI9713750.1 unnamed protein product [Rangifer tarandus platyrhynchus]